jgi:hypothetical protein
MLDKLQKMEIHLSDRIKGWCSGIEHKLTEVEQRVEEWFISLEMVRTESKSRHMDMEKHVDSLKLEVHRLNRFLERETMANPQDKPSIFTTVESARPSTSHVAADGPDGCRVDNFPRDCEFGSASTHTHVLDNGTLLAKSHVVDSALDHVRSHQFCDLVKSSRASQVQLPKLQFPVFNREDPQLWHSRCDNYFDMYGVESALWV